MTKRIAILATGDEIIHGDILNTNTRDFAAHLFSHGMQPGMQMTASDTRAEIETAIRFLLNTHDALIISGGLGPTSDDRTRFALADVLARPLEFHEPSWQRILARFAKYHITDQPDSNRQQCLFPVDAVIFANTHGTADGCQVRHENKLIFMLPGPPRECLPLLTQYVLPSLMHEAFSTRAVHRSWLLLGVSEGALAAKLDAIAEKYHVTTGYRAQIPYVEFKLQANDPAEIEAFLQAAQDYILPFQINLKNIPASDLLKQELINQQLTLSIHDEATKGLFQAKLTSPATYHLLNPPQAADFHVAISGLTEVWAQTDSPKTTLTINGHDFVLNNRQGRTLIHAIELIAQFIDTAHPKQANH